MVDSIGGLIIVVLACVGGIYIYRATVDRNPASRVACPACKEFVVIGAMVCPFCHIRFTEGQPRIYMRAAVERQRLEIKQARAGNALVLVALLLIIAGIFVFLWRSTR